MSAKRSNQKVIQQKYPMLYLIPLIAVLAVIPALLYECDVNTGLTNITGIPVHRQRSISFCM